MTYPEKGKVAEVKSRPDGVFVLKDIPKGSYDIWAISEAPLVVSSKTLIPVTVSDGKNVVGIAVKLQRGAAIKGRLVTSTGVAVEKATIVGTGGVSAISDQNGNFLVPGVAVGDVDLTVMAPSIGVKTLKVTSVLGTYTDAGPVILTVGTDSTIKGMVVDSSGAPVPGVTLVASAGFGSGAYTMGQDSGQFSMSGLDKSKKYKVDVIAYGYEPLTLSEVAVPTTDLSITLNPSQQNVAGMMRYRYDGEKSDVELMYSDMIMPAAYATCSKGACPEGVWYGYSVDMTGMFIPINVFMIGGGSFSIGRHACNSSLSRLDFTSFCKYVGLTNAFVSFGVSASGYRCKKACCGEELYGKSQGGMIMLSSGLRGGAGGLDFSGDTSCFSWSAGLGWDLPIEGGNLPYTGVIAYRDCDTFEPVNVFEYYLH